MSDIVKQIIDQSQPYEDADFLRAVFGNCRPEAISGSKPVVLFGAGSAGRRLLPLLQLHGIYPICFCDNNSSLTGSSYSDVPIISLRDLLRSHKESLIVITTNKYLREITDLLMENGFDRENILCINQDALVYYTHIPRWHWPLSDLTSAEEKLQKAYDLLSDEISKNIFINRIALFTRGADYKSYEKFINMFQEKRQVITSHQQLEAPSDPVNYYYFSNDIFRLGQNEIFIDGGAYTGDSVSEFIRACEENNLHYRSIDCFEPDPLNYEQLVKNLSGFPNVVCHNLGLWSHSTALQFQGSQQRSAKEARIVRKAGEKDEVRASASGTEITVETTSIDEKFRNREVTLIKMDIEGAEAEALIGAAETIKKNKPKLVISAYHKRNDLYILPLVIHSLCSEYRLYLRHYSDDLSETVLFATVPG